MNSGNKILWVVGIISIAIIAALVSYRFFVFQIISTTPKNGGEANSSSQTLVVIETNKDLEQNNESLQVLASDDIVNGYKIEKNKLLIQLRNMSINKSYELYIKNIKASDQSKINSYTLKFKNTYQNFNTLSKEEQDKQIADTDKGNIDDPVVKYLPITTDAYYISYVLYDKPDEKGKYQKIVIALLISNPDLENTQMIQDYKKQALDYLKSKGINPNEYVLEYHPEVAKDL